MKAPKGTHQDKLMQLLTRPGRSDKKQGPHTGVQREGAEGEENEDINNLM